RLGIVVDLAHAGHETARGALKVSTQPMIISHTSFDLRPGKNPPMAKMMAPRLSRKEHARVDAGGGGGVWTKLSDSMGEFVAGSKALADAIGIDHVGIGSDTDILSSRAGQSTNTPGLACPADSSRRPSRRCYSRASRPARSPRSAAATSA